MKFLIISFFKLSLSLLTSATSFRDGARRNGVDVTIERFMHFRRRGPLSPLLLIGGDFAKCKTFSLHA